MVVALPRSKALSAVHSAASLPSVGSQSQLRGPCPNQAMQPGAPAAAKQFQKPRDGAGHEGSLEAILFPPGQGVCGSRCSGLGAVGSTDVTPGQRGDGRAGLGTGGCRRAFL